MDRANAEKIKTKISIVNEDFTKSPYYNIYSFLLFYYLIFHSS